jgi:DNA-binding winged helix-turn-helix (wHTH) protein/Tol biopolymer transport system component
MSIYEFGPFRLDPVERRLTRDGSVVPLSSKALDTLLLLVRNAGHLLDKETLMKALWPDTFVEEGTLAQNVSTLRRALGERPDSPRFIETVPRRGYRFLAPVREVHEPIAASVQHATAAGLEETGREREREAASAHPGSRRIWVYAALAAMLAVALGSLRSGPSASWDISEQLTNLTDSATSPILSPDGRMLAFIRGGQGFLSDGEIWVKILPDGEAVQLTHEPLPISTPAFSPDGSHIAYTVTDVRRVAWDTWMVPVLGGEPRRLLANATGLTWIGDRRILFSEIKRGMHMGVVAAAENRSDARAVYTPAHERAMAHYSHLSPDGRWVLVVEMDPTWLQCRLVPFDGPSTGRPVGPEGACTAAAWSQDGRWMYFGATLDGESHLWRQRFPDGRPEQMTFGPTEEEGIAMAPDGRSLITAIGFRQGSIRVHGPNGEREVSSQGDASRPSFGPDGRRLYYLLRPRRSSPTNELWVTDLVAGSSEPLITGFSIATYDVSPDEGEVVLAASRSGGTSEIWVAPLDRRAPPERIAEAGETPFFGPGGEVVFKGSEGNRNYLYKIGADRSGRQKVIEHAISNVFSHSPDGKWVIALAPNPDGEPAATMRAIQVADGANLRVCAGGCLTSWSPDAGFFQIAFHPTSLTEGVETFAIPLPPGRQLPALPPSGFVSGEEVAALPGVRRFERPGSVPGMDPATYAFVKPTLHKNLYRIALR